MVNAGVRAEEVINPSASDAWNSCVTAHGTFWKNPDEQRSSDHSLNDIGIVLTGIEDRAGPEKREI